MSLKYSGPEVMEMAVQTERGGKAFYEEVAGHTDHEELRGLFRFLAAEEDKHVATFRQIARTIAERPEEMPYKWDEVVPYINALVSSRYFLDGDKALALARQATTPRAALEHAIGFEKETLLFYTELFDLVAEQNRAAVRALVAEEKTHVVKLSRLLSSL
ncbi:ferritin family protein, partial [candidate division WOR-3 bacterium]|nr:ferritin family protein [candidate division WOR-3 bacterium]